MEQRFKQSPPQHRCITILFCHLIFEAGTNILRKPAIQLLSAPSNLSLILISRDHLNIITVVLELAKYTMLTACSALNQHLFSKNIVNSPSCSCGAVEDSHHFLFVCNLYIDLRRTIFQVVSVIQQPLLNLLVFGSQELANDQNKTIFIAVQEYIVNTKRFKIN